MKRASRTTSARIHKLAGQLEGVERMLRAKRSCPEVLHQLLAVQSGIRQVASILIREEVRRTAGTTRGLKHLESLISQLSPL